MYKNLLLDTDKIFALWMHIVWMILHDPKRKSIPDIGIA